MEREQKNQMLADLYALRAGMSAISIERDKFGVKEKAYSDAKRKVDCACYEYKMQRIPYRVAMSTTRKTRCRKPKRR